MSSPTSITPRFVSVWDGGNEIETPCTIDFATGIVLPEAASDGVESLVTTLDSQHVMIGEFSVEITDKVGEIRVARPAELPVLALFAASLEELPSYVDLESFFEHSSNTTANTQIDYMYRDAGNYKKFETVIFNGAITPCQIKIIEESFMPDFEETDFLPRQVDLAPLCPWVDEDEYDDELDHMIHTISGVKLVDSPDNGISIVDLVNKFAAARADGWDMVKYGNNPF